MARLGLHLRSEFHELLLCYLALVHNLVTLLVSQVRNLSHLLSSLGLVLIEDGNVVFEVLAELVSLLHRQTNGLQALQTGSLVCQWRVFTVSIDPLLGCEQVIEEGLFQSWVDVVL